MFFFIFLCDVEMSRIGHQSLSILFRTTHNLLSVLEFYEFCTPCHQIISYLTILQARSCKSLLDFLTRLNCGRATGFRLSIFDVRKTFLFLHSTESTKPPERVAVFWWRCRELNSSPNQGAIVILQCVGHSLGLKSLTKE